MVCLTPARRTIAECDVVYNATFDKREKGEKLTKYLVGAILQIGYRELGW